MRPGTGIACKTSWHLWLASVQERKMEGQTMIQVLAAGWLLLPLPEAECFYKPTRKDREWVS